ncbi:MAG: hypothetical protein HKN62_05830 [Phycisphaerales bacterium]|nr:hypothetical protein [Phycisphaerales bacterium]
MTAMASGTWVTWAGGIGLLVVFIGLLFAAWWSLFSDRPRGRRRCPQCWYDLTYSPGMRCGECGHTGRRESEFTRTRRRLGVFLMSVVGCSLVGVYVIDHVNSQGWMSYVPTRGLVWMLPHVDDRSALITNELIVRIRGDDLEESDWHALLRRCVNGDGGAQPPSEAWIAKYGLFATAGGRVLMSSDDEQVRDAAALLMLDIARQELPEVELSTRERWPEAVAPTVDVRVRDWWQNPTHMRIIAQPTLPEAEPARHICRDDPIQPRSYSMYLPPLAPGEHEVDIVLDIERRAGPGHPWVPIGERTVTVPLAVDAGLARTLQPVSGPAYDRQVARAFQDGLSKWEDGSLPVRVGVNSRRTFSRLFDDTAVAVRVEVMRNGKVGRHLDIWWRGGIGYFEREHAWEVPWWNDELLGAPDEPDDKWVLRVTSRPTLAFRVSGVTKYWEGEVEVPVRVRTRSGNAPPRGWIVDTEDAPGDGPV